MPKKRNPKLDLFALALLAVVVFLTLSLATFHPADPPSNLVYPPGDTVRNACGPAGAMAAHLLLQGLGIGAYYVVLSLAVLDYLLLRRRNIDQPVLRTVGWALSLAGLTALVALVAPGGSQGPVIGPGGYLGALGMGVLTMNFATIGAFILALSVVLAGVLLCTDYYLFGLAARAVNVGVGGVAGVRRRVRPTTDADTDADSEEYDDADEVDEWEYEDDEEEEDAYEEDEYEDEEEDEEPAEPAIRIRTQADEAEDDADAAAEADSDDAEAKPSVKKRLASALRIKKPKKSDREAMMAELEAAVHEDDALDYELPSIDLLLPSDDVAYEEQEKEVRRKAKLLEKTFANFGFNVRVVEIETGPVIAQYEVELEAGLRLSRITGLADDLAIALRVPSVRIVAPIPGKNTVGIEVPNDNRQMVRLREVMEEVNGKAKRMNIPIYVGKDVAGRPMVVDLASMPHLLIAGRTGTGKSVCLNSMIVSMLMTRRPDEVRMLLIDPKMVELSPYKRLPHLMHPVVTDMRKAEAILAWAVEKMEERYSLLANAGVRHVSVYNQLGREELIERLQPETDEERDAIPTHLPFIVIVADEMADLMMTAGKDVEQHIIRLAQKSRAVGIHLILATQKPTVDVITGLIKSNLPARLAFQVSSRTDSRVVLDEMGADKLLGNGDMLFLQPGTSSLLRGQGTFLSDDEINNVVDACAKTEQTFVKELVQLKTKDEEEASAPGALKNRDELYESAVDVVVRERRGSVSLLQRTLGIGYGRAARLIDFMAEDGIVGEYNGSQAREVILTVEDWETMSGEEPSSSAASPSEETKPRRSNKIIPNHDDEEEEEDETAVAEAEDVEDEGEAEDADEEDAGDDDEEEEYEEYDEEEEDEYDEEDEADDDEYEYVYEDEEEDEAEEPPFQESA